MLAIFCEELFRPSETFITRHIRELAPGKTVVICQEGGCAEEYQFPIFRIPSRERDLYPWLHRKAVGIWTLFRKGSELAPMGKAEQSLSGFLLTHKVKVIMAEFGHLGCIISKSSLSAGNAGSDR